MAKISSIILQYSLKNKLLFSILILYGILLLLNALGIHAWLPGCPFTTYLGVECLGCGLNRAAISLLQFHVKEAWQYNPLIFVYLPLLVTWIIYDFYKYWNKQSDFSFKNNPNGPI